MDAIFGAFCDAEFDRDWAQCRERFGDEACVALMERTPAQRRFDALHEVFAAAAAAAPDDVRVPDPLVNIIVDQRTFEEHVAHAAGGPAPEPDPGSVDQRRCETTNGVQLDPRDVVAAAWVGHVRRVVFDSASVTIDLGRRRRLFTGSARDAALLQGHRCLWPGCGQPRSQLDHHDEWSTDGGVTDQANAGPLCGRHNPLEAPRLPGAAPTRRHHRDHPPRRHPLNQPRAA